MKLQSFDLQLFAGEKTEPATPKKRREARRKGQTARSMELSGALVLLVAIVVIYVLLPLPSYEMAGYAKNTWANLTQEELSVQTASRLLGASIVQIGLVTLPLFAALMLVAWVGSLAQVGFLLTGEPLKMNANRLNPIEGLKRLFSKKALVGLAKSLLKLLGIAWIAYQALTPALHWVATQHWINVQESFQALGHIIFLACLRVALFLAVLGVLDYVYQRYELATSLRMSKQEVKEEHKQMEGDPQLRARIREKQRLMARRRMMQDVPRADVIITNPIHLAIALKYDPVSSDAPVVVAKGQGYLADKIRSIAKENRIAIVEDKPLAQALFKAAEVGESIPPQFFQAVAEVLAFVFRQRGYGI